MEWWYLFDGLGDNTPCGINPVNVIRWEQRQSEGWIQLFFVDGTSKVYQGVKAQQLEAYISDTTKPNPGIFNVAGGSGVAENGGRKQPIKRTHNRL